MRRFFITQITIFGIIDRAMENVKIIIWAVENMSIPLDRARPVVFGTSVETFVARS